ncbi:mannose-1-phosphate guanylyltransferase/mannose-6-phosphate isomerase [Diaphorobacter sp. HDW4A]|uniref:mannose-1-phosphate guanylyltransferase/mannose-6-phosphate isomerase n=1 Tax=Diaphorobacter sp. HDW4A TaxID=2714924 RepID=UPI00140C8D68|nr:mannose-1-phosphate guanylyltransferase/mannose-6-phosphate isomerase [Diaphorobacter sp. HDW4A]QIL81651.1 mannose-1-phosphate guanylyltransferase/mannose-6-phosphate isomerase [Diaphorobacter sp. HDW4A]
MTDQLLPVILCGGSGTRLWPLSRETYPKQFHALAGTASMLQDTATRLQGIDSEVQLSAPLLVCNVEHRFLVATQLQQSNIENARILLEPAGRNTAPALTIAALQARAEGADPVMLAMPADHVIADKPAFHAAVQSAFRAASKGDMVTFGIVADRPETGYGYIQHGTTEQGDTFEVQSFVEKPDRERAQNYLAAGNYLWNSGLFVVRASVWLKAMQQFRSDILAACEQSMSNAQRDTDFVRPEADAFKSSPSDSIDYAVMERLPKMPELGIAARVIPLNAGWSDVGAWDALWSVREHDENGNAIIGNAVQRGCKNSLFLSSSRLVAGVGLEHIAVVETPDAILVADLRRTQEVKQIVAHLQKHGKDLAHSHRKVHRPWGWYDSIDYGERFQVKRIVVNPGASLSLQMHHHRAEHWVVVKGTAEVTNGDQVLLLGENESTFIPLGHVHRLRNPGKMPLEIVEVQSGSYLGEDDIVRFEDTYGRVPAAPAGA